MIKVILLLNVIFIIAMIIAGSDKNVESRTEREEEILEEDSKEEKKIRFPG